jgi:DNA-binding PadR family transcriptional regulator
MTSPPHASHIVTPLQFAFLTALSEKAMTGKQMRAELAQCGLHKKEAAFFRVIQRLKRDGLIKATRIPRDFDEYRGAQCEYELTRAGRDAVALMRGLCRKAERRVRRMRWQRKGASACPSFQSRCRTNRHLPTRSVVRERADRSQVTDLLTNVRSGRRRLALLSVVTIYITRAYNAAAALGAMSSCQNGGEPKRCQLDPSFSVDNRTPLLVESKHSALDSKPPVLDSRHPVGDSRPPFLKFVTPTARFETSRRQQEVTRRRLEVVFRHLKAVGRQSGEANQQIRSLESAIRGLQSFAQRVQSITRIDHSRDRCAWRTGRFRLRTPRAREPPGRWSSNLGRAFSRPSTEARSMMAASNTNKRSI